MKDIEFKHIGLGFYSVVRNSFIFRPEAFIRLSSNGIVYNKIAFNIWRRR